MEKLEHQFAGMTTDEQTTDADISSRCHLCCCIHNVGDDVDAVAEVRTILENYVDVEQCQQVKETILRRGQSVRVDVTPKSGPAGQQPRPKNGEHFAELFRTLWCCRITASTDARCKNMWLETLHLPSSVDYLKRPIHRLAVNEVSVGTFVAPSLYQCHWKSAYNRTNTSLSDEEATDDDEENEDAEERRSEATAMTATFEHDSEMVRIEWRETGKTRWRMQLTLDCLAGRCFLVARQGFVGRLYLFVNSQPKLFRGRYKSFPVDRNDPRSLSTNRLVWERHIRFGSCDRDVLGSSNVVSLLVPVDGTMQGLLYRLQKQGFKVCYVNSDGMHPIRQVDTTTAQRLWPQFASFGAAYAWYCLLTRGFKVLDQVTDEFTAIVEEHKDDRKLEDALNSICHLVDNTLVCDLIGELRAQLTNGDSGETNDLQIEPNYVSVRRLVLTPTSVRGLPPEPVVGNRIIREFGADRFIRVLIRDEDFEQLNASAGRIREVVKTVTDFLRQDLTIGDRSYHFLGCSNSQLREHGFWMYASDGVEGHTVEEMRRWMGDLSEERCVASYVARLGQFFSSSRNAIVTKCAEEIEDVWTEDGRYCFTDGIGKISEGLAKKVSRKLGLPYRPSAFQVRYGGCKGVLAMCPLLTGDKIQVRASMKKFESTHTELDVVGWSLPGRLYLNRQVIVLMSGLGIKDAAFFSLQETVLQQMATILTDEEQAAKVLSTVNLDFTSTSSMERRISLTAEPFLRSLLMNVYQHRLNELARRARIEIPADKGRIMMGTVDETGTLNYGEVFVQFSRNIDQPHVETEVLRGTVVIAKNPCFHPGDMRKFQAVDVPALKHMVDCVVFPCKGSRPHPNEMSGSDLDGDMYFVCWEESLIPPEDNKEAMDYTPPKKSELARSVTESDMIDFIGQYIGGDHLGVIANAHLVHADAQKDGNFSEQCLELAQLHSDAVDSPKSGNVVSINPNLRPQNYPRYLEKPDKPEYLSNHVLALLYDQCDAIRSTLVEAGGRESDRRIVGDYIVDGYEAYLEDARRLESFYGGQVRALMSSYGIETEAELITGCILKFAKNVRGTVKREYVDVSKAVRSQVASLRKAVRHQFYVKLPWSDCSDVSIRKASALYHVTYVERDSTSTLLGLPWMFANLLISAKNINEDKDIVGDSAVSDAAISTRVLSPNQTVMDRITDELITFSRSHVDDESIARGRNNRRLVFRSIASDLGNTVRLAVFGSSVTGFDGESSTLDVLVVCSAQSDIDHVMQTVSQRFGKPQQLAQLTYSSDATRRKPTSFDAKQQNVRLRLYWSEAYLRKTAYILAAISRNRWIVPVVRTILAWARRKDVVGICRDSLMTSEQLVLMFLSFAQHECHQYVGVTETDITETTDQLLQNHFSEGLEHGGGSAGIFEKDDVSETGIHIDLSAVLFKFFHCYSRMRGNIVKETIDPSCMPKSRLLVHMQTPQHLIVADRMLQAYHFLAYSGSVCQLLQLDALTQKSSSERLVLKVARQSASLIFLTRQYFERKLLSVTGVESLKIRTKSYMNSDPGLILEAWGNAASLERVRDEMRQLEKKSAFFVESLSPIEREKIPKAFMLFFEGSDASSDKLQLVDHTGPVQPNHRKDQKRNVVRVPRLLDPSPSDTASREKFVQDAMMQLTLMLRSYDEVRHGHIRAVISYGTYYVVVDRPDRREMTVAEFQRFLNASGGHPSNAALVNQNPSHPRDGRSRHVGRGGRYQTTGGDIWRRSFIPAGKLNVDGKQLADFLRSEGYCQVESYKKYLINLKLKVHEKMLSMDCVLQLDGDFRLEGMTTPDLKWLCADIITTKQPPGKPPFDIRFKIHSRRLIPTPDMSKLDRDFRILIETINRKELLKRNRMDQVIGVHPNYKNRIQFMRFKDSEVFELAANIQAPSTDKFLHGTTIRLNRGQEYSSPDPSGRFSPADVQRTEVTIVPVMPDIGDSDQMVDFFRNTWTFSRNFAKFIM